MFSNYSLTKMLALLLLLLLAAGTEAKRGLAFNDNIDITGFRNSKVWWGYNWFSSTSISKSDWNFIEYVPMLWSLNTAHTNAWAGDVAKALAPDSNSGGGSGHLLAFNEPDNCTGGTCISVADAVQGWRTYMEPYHGHAGLVSPAVTNAGLPWLSSFLDQCTGCNIDYVAVHWYDRFDNVAYFKNWLVDVKQRAGGRLIWIIEASSPLDVLKLRLLLTALIV
jgi:hypothetical protein